MTSLQHTTHHHKKHFYSALLLSSMLSTPFANYSMSNRDAWIAGGLCGAFALICHTLYNKSALEQANSRLNTYQSQCTQCAQKYSALQDYTDQTLEATFIDKQGLQAAVPSIEQTVATVQEDRHRIEQLVRELSTEKKSWNNNTHYDHQRANSVLEHAQQIAALLTAHEKALSHHVAPINLRITYQGIQAQFSTLIKTMENQKQLDEIIRQTLPQQVYPHLECYNRASVARHTLASKAAQVAPEKPVARDSYILGESLHRLMSRIVNSPKYSEQQRDKVQAEDLHRQALAQEAAARAEKQRAQAEAERLFVEKNLLQEQQKANVLKERELELQKQQLIAHAAAAAANAITHSSCNQEIAQLTQAHNNCSREVAQQRQQINTQRDQLAQQRDTLQTLQATANSLRDALAQAPDPKKLKPALTDLENAIRQPGFNINAAETPFDEPGVPGEVQKWHTTLIAKVAQLGKLVK